MTRTRTLLALVALTTLTACDSADRADSRAEQDDRAYRSAMEDYRAGRLDVAIAGFEKAVFSDPANASARFQLGCLLQDARKDHVGAYCCYREYLMQRPGSDKAKLAQDRMAICEREAAKELAAKYGLNESAAAAAELETVRGNLRAAEARIAVSEQNLGESLARVRALSAERDRLLAVIRGGEIEEQSAAAHPSVKEARELLEEEDEEVSAAPSSAELRKLVGEESADQASGSTLLPKSETRAERKQDRQERKPAAKAVAERPKTYLVQEGDTLYGVSKRFYGSIAMWKKIRDANKALISMDNRLHVGDTIVLPEP
ncbi:MAG: LysM peptidoglycan-binding domain-containing protein [Kiritimatiellia bacterium]